MPSDQSVWGDGFDAMRPDFRGAPARPARLVRGAPRRRLDTSRACDPLGRHARASLHDGPERTIAW